MGVSLVDPATSSEHSQTAAVTVQSVGPRTTEWLPNLHAALLPAAVRTVRDLAYSYDPRILQDKRPRLFAREALHQQYGVGTWAHTYPEAITQYALRYAGIDPDALAERERRKYDELRQELTTFGTGRDTFNTGLDALEATTIPLLEQAENANLPAVKLFLDGPAWTAITDERTAERALDTIALFGEVCDVRLVCSPRLEHHLERVHPEWYDTHLCLTGHRDGSGAGPTTGQPESALTAAWERVGQFTPGGGRLRLLAALSADTVREVRDLKRDTELDLSAGTIDRYVRELADEHGLVAIDDRHTSNRVSLTETGRAAQTLLSSNCELRHPEQARLDADLTRTPHDTTSVVCRADARDGSTPAAGGGSSGSGAGGAAAHASSVSASTSPSTEQSLPASAPSAEAWLADTGTAASDGYVQWLDGPTGCLDGWAMHERLLAGRRVEGVTFVDEPIKSFDDGTVSYVSCFEDHAQVVVQWGGPLPTLVRITNALLSEKMWSKVLTPSAVGDTLDELYDGALNDAVQDVLRLGAQIGWFSEAEHDYDSLRERYGAVRRRLLSQLGTVTGNEQAEEWGDLCRDAQGLLASATHLYQAIETDITIHLRVPDTATLQAGEQRYQAFCDFFKHTVPKNAAYGVHSVYRMLIEDRVDKLKHRLSYEFDEQPTADLTASWVVSGPTATTFREDVEQAIAATATDVRERIKNGDEQGAALQIPVVDGTTYGALRRVLDRHADRKGYEQPAPDTRRRLIRLATATLGTEPGRCSPYALAEALLTMATARSPTATLAPADVAYGLAQLPADRLLPSLPPTMQQAIKVLLVADEPLGRSTIIERADIAEASYDRNIDEVAALGIVEATGNGGHRKWQAWLLPWWSSLATVERPRTAKNDTAPAPPSRWDDVLYEIALALDLEPAYDLFAGQVDIDAVFDALPALNRWRNFFEAHAGLGLIATATAREAESGMETPTNGSQRSATDAFAVASIAVDSTQSP